MTFALFRSPARDQTAPSRTLSLALLFIGCTAFLGCVVLVLGHAAAIREMRDTTLPLASDVPALEQRLKLLKGQIEASQLQAALRTGSAEEKLHVYVLPEQVDIDRVVAIFDIVRAALQRSKLLKDMSPLTFGDATPFALKTDGDALSVRPVTATFTVKEEGMQTLLQFLSLSGLLTIGDTLSAEEMKMLLALTESENPTGITALEPYLAADLASYVREPRPHDDRLLKSFSADTFVPAFQKLMDESLLKDAQSFLSGDIGSVLVDRKLWPLPFFLPQHMAVSDAGDGWVTLDLTVGAFARE